MREIPLTRGMVALVDDVDYAKVIELNWQAARDKKTWYAAACVGRTPNGKRLFTKLHRTVLDLSAGDPLVDHIDGNGLNCQRANLRLVTSSQNSQNRRGTKGPASSSRFKGVNGPRYGKWAARIGLTMNGKRVLVHLGSFVSEEDAARAYDTAATQHFGEFAALNFPSS